MTTDSIRIPIRFDRWYSLMSSALFLPASAAFVDVRLESVSVQMGWAFRATFPRSSIRATRRLDTAPLSRGVHGLGGRWLVNGASDRIVVIDLEPTERARVLGFPVQLRQLMVSVDDPESLIDRLRAR